MPNLLAFGADQTVESIFASRYFDKLAVVLHIVNIVVRLGDIFIGDDKGYFTSYVIGTSMISFAVVLFFIGWRYYIHIKPYDSVITNCIPVVINAFHSWRQHKKSKRSIDEKHSFFIKLFR